MRTQAKTAVILFNSQISSRCTSYFNSKILSYTQQIAVLQLKLGRCKYLAVINIASSQLLTTLNKTSNTLVLPSLRMLVEVNISCIILLLLNKSKTSWIYSKWRSAL